MRPLHVFFLYYNRDGGSRSDPSFLIEYFSFELVYDLTRYTRYLIGLDRGVRGTLSVVKVPPILPGTLSLRNVATFGISASSVPILQQDPLSRPGT